MFGHFTGSNIAFLVVAGVLGGAFAVFLITGVLEGSLVKIGIAAALLVAVYGIRVYRYKRMKDEMDEMERWK